MHTEQLQVMVKNLRAECGHSLSIAQGVNQAETLKYLLARTQEELWVAFVWPELKFRAPVTLASGQYAYPYPATMPFDNIREVWVAPSGPSQDIHWTSVEYGIPEEDMILPDMTNSERGDPVQYWESEDNGPPATFRVWPTPDSSTRMRLIGQETLKAFIADSDTCTIDATAITLFTAADLLSRAKAEDAANKMQKAQRHLQKLLGNKVSAKMKVSTLGGGSPNRNTQSSAILFGRGF